MTLDLFAPKKHAPTLHHGDCLAVLKTLDDASVDAVVTDPPYLIDFMGKGWDSADGIAGKPEVWAECLRVLKPGGHLLAFGATRTYHRMTCAIEDAGFEIRDSIHWMYSTGFPKSLDVSKAMDKAAGAEREIVGESRTRLQLEDHDDTYGGWKGKERTAGGGVPITAPATDLAKQWQGWGTALKPAHEAVVVARKPLAGTVAANVQRYGTGALNIDASRVGTVSWKHPGSPAVRTTAYGDFAGKDARTHEGGRWPPNIVLSHTEDCAESTCDETCAVAELDRQSGTSSSTNHRRGVGMGFHGADGDRGAVGHSDSGGASRFFPVFRYQAKASRSERGETNVHPTVKPIALMEWLVALVTPPGGTVLDPFMGSGTTGVAAARKGFRFVGIEREDEYLAIARARIEAA